MYSALVPVKTPSVDGKEGVRVWFGVLALSKVTSGVCGFPLRTLCFGLCPLRLPGAFRRTAAVSDSRGGHIRLRLDILAVGSLQLVVLHTAQLFRGGPGTQRPLLVSLAEGVGAELAEGF